MFKYQLPSTIPSMPAWRMWTQAMKHHNQARIAQKRREYARAEQLSREAESLCLSSGYEEFLPDIRFRLAISLFWQEQLEQALLTWSILLEEPQTLSKKLLGECQLWLAKLELKRQRYSLALEWVELARQTFSQARLLGKVAEARKQKAIIMKRQPTVRPVTPPTQTHKLTPPRPVFTPSPSYPAGTYQR